MHTVLYYMLHTQYTLLADHAAAATKSVVLLLRIALRR